MTFSSLLDILQRPVDSRVPIGNKVLYSVA